MSSAKISTKALVIGLVILLIILIVLLIVFGAFKRKEPAPNTTLPQPTVAPYVLSDNAHTFDVSGTGDYPVFNKIYVDPFVGRAGDNQKLVIDIDEGTNPAMSAFATVEDDYGKKNISLAMSQRQGTLVSWQADWTIQQVQDKEYQITFILIDKDNVSRQMELLWNGQSSTTSLTPFKKLFSSIYRFFSVKEVYAEWVDKLSVITKDNFPHKGDANLDANIALGPGTINKRYITGVDGGNLVIMPGKTLQLNSYTDLVINPGFQVINNGGHTAISPGTAFIVTGYLWAKDADNDGCFDVTTVRYNESPNNPSASWGNGFKRISTLTYYPDPDDSNPGPAPACTASSYNLKVTKSGTGNGVITSLAPNEGIACGSICTAAFSYNKSVTLSVTPNPGSTFTGWSGDCTGTGNCTVVMGQARNVRASFDTNTVTISITKSGNGTGRVTSTPSGLACGSICSVSFPLGSEVILKATPSEGSVFSQWLDDCSGTRTTCTVDTDEDKEVEAKFSLSSGGGTYYKLTVLKTGSGMVNSTSISGINCGPDCEQSYLKDTQVTLTAYPDSGATFTNWSGGVCSGVGTTCDVTMSAAKTVTANFSTPTPTLHILTVQKTGNGSVSSWPSGISCGADCNNEYVAGLIVTLIATPDSNAVFAGWSGAGCTGTGSCQVTMDVAKTVTATFASLGYTVSIERTGGGSGTVTSTPLGINCGSDCSEPFSPNTLLTLTAAPFVGSNFAGWAGDGCNTNPTNTTCTFNVSSTRTITAVFTMGSNNYPLTVTKINATLGQVISTSPIGIDCGSTCSVNFVPNTSVTLLALPAAGASFAGWSGGDCTGTSTCAVVMTAPKTIIATFNSTISKYTLNVTKTGGTGTGRVLSATPGIDCGSDCSEDYDPNTPVILVPAPDSGSTFVSWSGACSGNDICNVTMSSAKSVNAKFDLTSSSAYELRVSTSGSGTVVSTPSGINCGTQCNKTFDVNQSVTLQAVPLEGYIFNSWGNDCEASEMNTVCIISMNSLKNVSATFSMANPTKYLLSLIKSGTGKGTVTGNNISCGLTCISQSAAYDPGAVVTLAASASASSTFAGWQGACTGTGSCPLTMNSAKEVTATFDIASSTGGGTTTFDFSLAANPATITVTRPISGTATSSFAVAATLLSGTAQPITIEFANVPTGVQMAGSTSSTCTPTCSVDLTAYVSSTAVQGTYQAEIRAYQSGNVIKTANLEIVINENSGGGGGNPPTSFDFGIALSPTTTTVTKPTSGTTPVTTTATLSLISGTAQPITISVSGATGITTTINPNSCTPNCTSVITFNIGSATVAQTYNITVQGVAGSVTKTATFTLTVNNASGGGGGGATYTLYVSKSGSSATITSSPAGINCGADCYENYTAGTSVTLTSNASTTQWGEACQGATGNTCTVIVNSTTNVTAVLSGTSGGGTGGTTTNYFLTVVKNTSGKVTSSPGSISCGYSGSTCTYSYLQDTAVTLTATPVSGYVFSSWAGDCSGTDVYMGTGTCYLTMNSAKNVSVNYAVSGGTGGGSVNSKLTVAKTGTGSGTITSTPIGINCGSTCYYDFTNNTSVKLTAAASSGSTFASWSGCSSTSGVYCYVTMTGVKSITATFNSSSGGGGTTPVTLSVTKTGTGTITGTGISCGTDCSESYTPGTTVTLTANAGSGYVLSTWGGGSCSGSYPSCSVLMNSAKSVSATFSASSGGGGSTNFTITTTSSVSVVKPTSGSKTVYASADATYTTTADRNVNWTVTVSPSGPTATFNAPSCTMNCGVSVVISVGSGVAKGPYTVTVKGTNTTGSKTSSISLTVN